jgi:hypothetical protein
MQTLLVCIYSISVGAQVTGQAEDHGHWVVMFVPYFHVENLATPGQ